MYGSVEISTWCGTNRLNSLMFELLNIHAQQNERINKNTDRLETGAFAVRLNAQNIPYQNCESVISQILLKSVV